MTFRQIEAFLAVAREASFSRAARRIHLSQPTLSEHVLELERELGKPLFLRRGRTVTLTEAGRVLEPYALQIVATLGDARNAVVELDGLGRGSLLVGASTTPGTYVLPRVIASLWQRHPGIDLTLRIANSRVIEEQIRANDLDLGVVGGHGLGPGERCLAAGLVDELVLIAAPSHPWTGQRRIGSPRLAEERVLVREDGSATRQVTERALQQAGVVLRRTMQLDHTEAIKQGVMAGLGVAFVSIHAVRGEVATRRLAIVPVRDLDVRRHFHVIHNDARTLGASARTFMLALDEQQAASKDAVRAARRRPARGR